MKQLLKKVRQEFFKALQEVGEDTTTVKQLFNEVILNNLLEEVPDTSTQELEINHNILANRKPSAVWLSKSGKTTRVEDMHIFYIKNALAKLQRGEYSTMSFEQESKWINIFEAEVYYRQLEENN